MQFSFREENTDFSPSLMVNRNTKQDYCFNSSLWCSVFLHDFWFNQVACVVNLHTLMPSYIMFLFVYLTIFLSPFLHRNFSGNQTWHQMSELNLLILHSEILTVRIKRVNVLLREIFTIFWADLTLVLCYIKPTYGNI